MKLQAGERPASLNYRGLKMNYQLKTIEMIERIIDVDLKPNIHLMDEKACLVRIKANLAELKFLLSKTQATEDNLK